MLETEWLQCVKNVSVFDKQAILMIIRFSLIVNHVVHNLSKQKAMRCLYSVNHLRPKKKNCIWFFHVGTFIQNQCITANSECTVHKANNYNPL